MSAARDALDAAGDALGLAALVRRGEISARDLVEASIQRIGALDPTIGALVHRMDESARRVASAAKTDGPFAGVPMLLKDLLASMAGEPITSGSRLLVGFRSRHDSEIVRRYRASGVIIVGTSKSPEFGLTPFTEPDLYGPAHNPWDLTRTPGGSSGGSAAAVASGMVPIAGGGDGGGSIRIPASCCGLFGLKPTRGRTPTGPDAAEWWQGAAVEHVITRSVRDSAAMLDAIAGTEPGAPYIVPSPERAWLDEVEREPGRLRIAFTTAPMLGHAVHADCVRATTDAAHLLESLGHELVDATPPVDREEFNRAFLTMLCAELRADVEEAARAVGRRASSSTLEPATWALAMLGRELTAEQLANARRTLQRASMHVGQFLAPYDLLLTPTLASPPVPIGSLQPKARDLATIKLLGRLHAGGLLKRLGMLEQAASEVFDFIPYTPLFNITGQPAMSVPLAWNDAGLPIGIQLVGRFADEATLFRVAGQLERARPWLPRLESLQRRLLGRD